jgi:hypothetical protein
LFNLISHIREPSFLTPVFLDIQVFKHRCTSKNMSMKPYLYPNGRAYTKKVRPQNKKLVLFILFILLAILSFS